MTLSERALCHIDGCYSFGQLQWTGQLCRTNLQSSTAFRGFGAPQAMFATETIMEHVAMTVEKATNEVRTALLSCIVRSIDSGDVDIVTIKFT